MNNNNGLIELCPIMDTYTDDIGAVDNLGSCCRVTFFTWARPYGGGAPEKVVVAKIIRPLASLRIGAISQMLRPIPMIGGPVILN